MKVSSTNHSKSGSHHHNNGRSNNNNHDDAATTLQYWKTKMGHNNCTTTSTTETTKSEIWLTAISTAEHRRRNDARDAAGYLGHLKHLLQRHNNGSGSNNRMAPQWNNPPTFYPPPPRWDRGLVRNIEQRRAQNDAYNGYGTQNNINNEDALVDEIASSMMPRLTVSSTPTRSSTTNQNQYSVFDDDDDEHDDDSDNEIEGEEIVYNSPRMQQQ